MMSENAVQASVSLVPMPSLMALFTVMAAKKLRGRGCEKKL